MNMIIFSEPVYFYKDIIHLNTFTIIGNQAINTTHREHGIIIIRVNL